MAPSRVLQVYELLTSLSSYWSCFLPSMVSGVELEGSLSSTHSSREFSLTLLWAPVLSQELDRHWEGSRDSNPNIGCLPVSKNTHVFPFGKIKLIYTIKIALKQQQAPGNRGEISTITFLTPPGSFHPKWTSCHTTHAQNLPGFFWGRLFWRQNTGVHLWQLSLFSNFNI